MWQFLKFGQVEMLGDLFGFKRSAHGVAVPACDGPPRPPSGIDLPVSDAVFGVPWGGKRAFENPIPADALAQSDGEIYRRRNEFKHLFRHRKGQRRIFSRFEKLDLMFTASISFAVIADGFRLCCHALVELRADSTPFPPSPHLGGP